jgi:hypothetical protein
MLAGAVTELMAAFFVCLFAKLVYLPTASLPGDGDAAAL